MTSRGRSAGLAVAGNIGAANRFEYTVIGDPVNEASRLTELAKLRPTRVLASSSAVYFADVIQKPTAEEIEEAEAHHGNGHHELESGEDDQRGITSGHQ